jgi:hypothetical protein
MAGNGEYNYNFGQDKTIFNGGISKWRLQARELFDVYLKNDQFRVKQIKLSDINLSSGNGIFWHTRTPGLKENDSHLTWGALSSYIHEITHAGIPLSWYKDVNDKKLLLPYGFDRTLDFVSDWLKNFSEPKATKLLK